MSTDPFVVPDDVTPEEIEAGVTERVFDNLAVWGLLAFAIAFLYLIWATVEIVTHLAGKMPGLVA